MLKQLFVIVYVLVLVFLANASNGAGAAADLEDAAPEVDQLIAESVLLGKTTPEIMPAIAPYAESMANESPAGRAATILALIQLIGSSLSEKQANIVGFAVLLEYDRMVSSPKDRLQHAKNILIIARKMPLLLDSMHVK